MRKASTRNSPTSSVTPAMVASVLPPNVLSPSEPARPTEVELLSPIAIATAPLPATTWVLLSAVSESVLAAIVPSLSLMTAWTVSVMVLTEASPANAKPVLPWLFLPLPWSLSEVLPGER